MSFRLVGVPKGNLVYECRRLIHVGIGSSANIAIAVAQWSPRGGRLLEVGCELGSEVAVLGCHLDGYHLFQVVSFGLFSSLNLSRQVVWSEPPLA
jgi:hypothetical protein